MHYSLNYTTYVTLLGFLTLILKLRVVLTTNIY